ncbi:MAG: Ig-like domain-containing protein [Bacteroidota bacterium]
MKMKNRYFKQIGAFILMSTLVFSCAEFEEFKPITVPDAPTFDLQTSAVADSAITVEVTSSLAGFIGVAVFEGTGNAIPDSLQLLRGNISSLDFVSVELEANTPAQIVFGTDIVQDAVYEIMMAASNIDGGAVSSVKVITVTTADHYGPGLVSTTPSVGTSAVYVPGGSFVLTFDEPVLVDESMDFIFSTYYLGYADVKGIVESVVGNTVTITPEVDLPNGDYVFLSYDGGTVTDLSGNACDTVVSGVIGGYLTGLYYRATYAAQEATTVAPDVAAAQAAGFDIVLTFDYNVRITGFTQGLTLVYETAFGDLAVPVTLADLAASGHDLTIHQAYDGSTPYTSVTLVIDEFAGGTAGIVTVGARNPLAEASYTWNML